MIKPIRWFSLCWLACSALSFAQPVTVAVASNFKSAASDLFSDFQQSTGQEIRLISGSSGKLYAQILHGAPFDLFLSADSARPKKLEEANLIVANSRKTYAQGRLVMWMPNAATEPTLEILKELHISRIAMANPKVAPYGNATRQVLEHNGMWSVVETKVVMGENVSQAFQFALSGNAQVAFVPLALILQAGISEQHIWLIPESQYPPIEQQMVLLNDSKEAQSLWHYLISEEVAERLILLGYKRP